MKKNNYLLIVTLIFFSNLFCQVPEKKKYVILTYEIINKKEIHKEDLYCWVEETDSIKNSKGFFPFYIKDFSSTTLENCLNNEVVNLFSLGKDEKWDFSDSFKDNQKKINDVILKKRKKILTVDLKRYNGSRERIIVYITPVQAALCHCKISNIDGKRINYHGDIFLLYDDVSYDESFWYNQDPLKYLYDRIALNNFVNKF